MQNRVLRASLAGFAIFFALQTTHVYAAEQSTASKCLQLFLGKLVRETEQQVAQPRKIETLDDLLVAFTEGFEPDLSIPQQRDAFEIYRKMRFGDPNTSLNSGTLDQVAKAVKKHPELKKEPFRPFRVEAQERIYPVTENLSTFLDSQVKSAGQVRGNLFQVDANRGYWKKIFQYEEPAQFRVATADKAARKALAKEADAHFDEFLSSRIPKEIREMLANTQTPAKERAKKLYGILMQERSRLKASGQDTRPISQAIVDLIHSIGYHDPAVAKSLKSTDGLERLGAFRKIREEGDTFAMELGYENHFEQVLKDFNTPQPTGVASARGMPEKLQALEDEVVSGAKIVKSSSSTKTIRHLSLAESPFRSCLGGSDCSSRTYLTRALDPNYHYFTLTDEQGFSTGHITVVLGEARSGGQEVKVGFVDKVQNVDNVDLTVMMEGVRRSLEEKGYTLVLPENLGDHNGISNESVTRNFIGRNIEVDQNHLMTSFSPHSHSYSFENAYSRAHQGLPVRSVLPLKRTQGVEITPGEIQHAWRMSDFNLEKLVQSSIQLKHGDVEDKIRYISSMKTIETAGLKGDPEFGATLQAWLSDSSLPFKLRKQVLLTEWTEGKKPLSKLLDHFSSNDQMTLIQNFLDTPRYRKVILGERKELPSLMVRVRENKKVRNMLVAEYSPNYREPIAKILDACDVSPGQAVKAIKQVEMSFNSTEVADVVQIQRLLSGTSVEPWLESQLVSNYMKNIHGNGALGRGLSAAVDSADPAMQRFGNLLLSQSLGSDARHFPIIQSYREILRVREAEGSSSLYEAAESWLRKPEVTPAHKGEFVMTQMGSGQAPGRPRFMSFLEAVPEAQRPAVWARIERQTNIPVFRKMAEKHGLESVLFDHGTLESFQFKPVITEEQARNGGVKFMMGEGESAHEVTLTQPFEMQVTPFTQLEAALATGGNRSMFVDGGFEITMNGKKVKIDPNRPAEQYSWEDQQAIMDSMNANDPKWNYRRPTEAEWEYAVRGGTDTKYSYGERDEGMRFHGWSYENSGGQTQPIARLRPNPFGLHDMHGNVWEWVEDWHGNYPRGSVTNPTGPTTGSGRVLRGGSWDDDAPDLRSALRNAGGPGDADADVGFRFVRTPK